MNENLSSHLKVSNYQRLLEAVEYRIGTREILWQYQMRRNRRVYRFSSLLAGKSAIDRLADAVVVHSSPVPRGKSTSNNKKPLRNLERPIVAFGGGQFRSGGNGLQSVPRKALVKKIAERTVVCMSEMNRSVKTKMAREQKKL